MTDLRTLMESATDRIEAPHLAGAAIAEMHRRRRRTRSALVVTAALATLAVMLGVSQLGPGDPHTDGPVDTPSTHLPQPDPIVSPSADGPATQTLWDPRDLPDAPVRASTLPAELSPPDSPGASVAEDPMAGVVVAWPQVGHDLRLLGTDGRWRTVPGTRDAVAGSMYDVARPAISHGGTRVAMSTLAGILVVDVTTGEELIVPLPTELAPPWDTPPELRWLPGDEGFLVLQWKNNWLVDLDGESRRAPYRGVLPSIAVDPGGDVYQNDYTLRSLITWRGDEVVREAPLYQCERLVAGYGMVGCTTGSLTPSQSGPLVVDPATGEVIAYAPIKDRNSLYSDNAHLTVLGFIDAETALLIAGSGDVSATQTGGDSWHLVAWEFRSGTFERISTGGTHMRTITVAPGLVE